MGAQNRIAVKERNGSDPLQSSPLMLPKLTYCQSPQYPNTFAHTLFISFARWCFSSFWSPVGITKAQPIIICFNESRGKDRYFCTAELILLKLKMLNARYLTFLGVVKQNKTLEDHFSKSVTWHFLQFFPRNCHGNFQAHTHFFISKVLCICSLFCSFGGPKRWENNIQEKN